MLSTDWSIHGMGAVLSQVFEDGEHPIAYASRSNNPAEKNYTSFKGELLAVVWACEHFRYQLLGRAFTLHSDHEPLSFVLKSQKLSGLYARWALRLQEFQITIAYKPGPANANADIVSRMPLPSTDDHWEDYHDGLDYFNSEEPCAAATALLLVCPVLAHSSGGADALAHNSGGADALDAHLPCGASPLGDIWQDSNVLHWLRHHSFPDSAPLGAERHRIKRRAASYRLEPTSGGAVPFRLLRRFDLRWLEVPSPAARPALIDRYHSVAHFARYKTLSQIRSAYWWYGMDQEVHTRIMSCPTCTGSKVVFRHSAKHLSPLPVMPHGHRVHIDLAGPLPVTAAGYKYFMVMIDSRSKWAEVIPIEHPTAKTTARVFYREWVCRYGPPAQVTTDNGREFEGEFKDELHRLFIDRRFTAPSHPQSNGLAERMVRTVKTALTRLIAARALRDKTLWDTLLPRISMAYNFSAQESLRCSPYFMMFGREPVFPSEAALHFQDDLVFSEAYPDTDFLADPDLLRASLLLRADALRRFSAFAFGNLLVAQHRQEQWYAQRRDGAYSRPAQDEFQPGQFAVTQIVNPHNLDSHAADLVLRVLYVRNNGILVLQGADGRLIRDNCSRWAPYHAAAVSAPYVDNDLVRQRCAARESDANDWCPLCFSADSEQDLWSRSGYGPSHRRTVVCDWCATMHHLKCLKLAELPQGQWFCPTCVAFNMPHPPNPPNLR